MTNLRKCFYLVIRKIYFDEDFDYQRSEFELIGPARKSIYGERTFESYFDELQKNFRRSNWGIISQILRESWSIGCTPHRTNMTVW